MMVRFFSHPSYMLNYIAYAPVTPVYSYKNCFYFEIWVSKSIFNNPIYLTLKFPILKRLSNVTKNTFFKTIFVHDSNIHLKIIYTLDIILIAILCRVEVEIIPNRYTFISNTFNSFLF